MAFSRLDAFLICICDLVSGLEGGRNLLKLLLKLIGIIVDFRIDVRAILDACQHTACVWALDPPAIWHFAEVSLIWLDLARAWSPRCSWCSPWKINVNLDRLEPNTVTKVQVAFIRCLELHLLLAIARLSPIVLRRPKAGHQSLVDCVVCGIDHHKVIRNVSFNLYPFTSRILRFESCFYFHWSWRTEFRHFD